MSKTHFFTFLSLQCRDPNQTGHVHVHDYKLVLEAGSAADWIKTDKWLEISITNILVNLALNLWCCLYKFEARVIKLDILLHHD